LLFLKDQNRRSGLLLGLATAAAALCYAHALTFPPAKWDTAWGIVPSLAGIAAGFDAILREIRWPYLIALAVSGVLAAILLKQRPRVTITRRLRPCCSARS
jgi:hypothetical protein